jgi:hypothetical protein
MLKAPWTISPNIYKVMSKYCQALRFINQINRSVEMGFLSNLFSDKSANINEYFADAVMVSLSTGSESAYMAAFAAATTAALGQRQSMTEYLKQMGQSINGEAQDAESRSAANVLIGFAALIDSKD